MEKPSIEDSRQIVQEMATDAYKEEFEHGIDAAIIVLQMLSDKCKTDNDGRCYTQDDCLEAIIKSKTRAFELYGNPPTIEVGMYGNISNSWN